MGVKGWRVEGGVREWRLGKWGYGNGEWGVGDSAKFNLVPLCLVGLMLAPETLRAASPGASLKLPPGTSPVPA